MRRNPLTWSSRNNLSARIYRPEIRTVMIAKANPVHHHETNKVGLLATAFLAGGGEEYHCRGRSISAGYQPSQRAGAGLILLNDCTTSPCFVVSEDDGLSWWVAKTTI